MSDDGGDETVLTIAEAAVQLQVTLPRLRRLLARPEFTAVLAKQERVTRTGTRTSTVIRESVLIVLNAALRGEGVPLAHIEREREREQVHNGNENGNALLEQLQSEVQFLRARLEAADVEKSELRRLMLSDKNELSELRQKLALNAAPEQTQESTSAPHSAKAEAAAGSVSWWKRFGKRGER